MFLFTKIIGSRFKKERDLIVTNAIKKSLKQYETITFSLDLIFYLDSRA